MTSKLIFSLGFLAILFSSATAQYWHVLPSLTDDKGLSAYFSNDDKRIYYIGKDSAGGRNIFSIELKTGAVSQITHYTDAPVIRMFHVPNRPQIVFMKASAAGTQDYHLYRIANNGTGTAEDLTPTKPGVTNIILGAHYNGSYVYYSSNKRSPEKTDYYRYDVDQNISEIVFSNDKNYQLMAWSRDANRVLLEDPATSKLFLSDVQTTEQFPLFSPTDGAQVTGAMLSPDNTKLLVVEKTASSCMLNSFDMTSPTSASTTAKTLDTGAITMIGATLGGRCFIEVKDGVTIFNDYQTQSITSLPNTVDLSSNPRETMMLQTMRQGNDVKFRIYDLNKKTAAEPIVVKNP